MVSHGPRLPVQFSAEADSNEHGISSDTRGITPVVDLGGHVIRPDKAMCTFATKHERTHSKQVQYTATYLSDIDSIQQEMGCSLHVHQSGREAIRSLSNQLIFGPASRYPFPKAHHVDSAGR